MNDELAKIGIYFDDLFTLRVLEPDISNDTNDLKDECSNFTQKLVEFRSIAEEFINIASNYAQLVDQQKMKTIGAQNLLKTFSKEKELEQQRLQAHISEKTLELERLKVELQYLKRIETDQEDVINNFCQNQ